MGRRLLKVRRVSRNHDDSTALAKQDAKLDSYADAMGDEIVGDACDSDVSGKTNPFERPELGPWLTQPHLMAKYDGLLVPALDRLGRSTKWISRLVEWAEENGKTIICLDPAIDFSTPTGKLISYIISWLAEQELAMITQRSADTRVFLAKNGHLIGKAPYGYMIVPDREHKGLAIDPEEAGHIRTMAGLYLAGMSLRDVATHMKAQGVLSPQGDTWVPKSISQIFRNPTLIGRRTNGDGQTVLKTDPILDRETFDRLQAMLDKKAYRKGVAPKQSHPLTGVVTCAKCGGAMYRVNASYKLKDGTKVDQYYMRCSGTVKAPSKCKNMFPLDELEERFQKMMARGLGLMRLYRDDVTPGHGYDDEIRDVEDEIARLRPRDPGYRQRHDELMAELERLVSLPSVPAKVERVWTGETVGEHWAGLETDAERRAFLVEDLRLELPVLRGKTRDEDRVGPHTIRARKGSSMWSDSLSQPFAADEPPVDFWPYGDEEQTA